MPIQQVNYANSKVYFVSNSENDILYVGSTAQPRLSTRMSGHRSHATAMRKNTPFYVAMSTIGIEKFQIHLHHAFPCASKAELEAEEFRTMELLQKAGKQLYNARTGVASFTAECRKKISESIMGDKHPRFNYGSTRFEGGKKPRWFFQYCVAGVANKKSFSVTKFGFWGAKVLADAARKAHYPEWKTDEELATDEFMAIELD